MAARQRIYLFLCGLIALFSSAISHASDSDCYMITSYGKATVHELGTKRIEDILFAQTNYIQGGYSTKPTSNPHSIGGGCKVARNFSVEIKHNAGLRAEVVSTVSVGGSFAGVDFQSDPVTILRYADLSGYSLGIVGEMRLLGPIFLIGEVAVMYSDNAFLAVTSPSIPENIEISKRYEGAVPITGIGLMYRKSDKSWAVGIGGQKYLGYVTIFNAFVRIPF
jgi:hypothetical protein